MLNWCRTKWLTDVQPQPDDEAAGSEQRGTMKNPIDSTDQGPQGYNHKLEFGVVVKHLHACDMCQATLCHTHYICARNGLDCFLTGPAGELCKSCAAQFSQQRVVSSTDKGTIVQMMHELRRSGMLTVKQKDELDWSLSQFVACAKGRWVVRSVLNLPAVLPGLLCKAFLWVMPIFDLCTLDEQATRCITF